MCPGDAAKPFCSKLLGVILKCVLIVRSFQNTPVNHANFTLPKRFNLHILLLIKLIERVVSCCSVSKHWIQLIQPINSHFSAFACIFMHCTDSPMLTFAYMTEIQKSRYDYVR